MVREKIYQELYLAITELPEECRKVFWLYFRGKSNREIAEILYLPEKDVQARKREVIFRLKSRLGDLFFWLQVMRVV